MSHVNDVKVKSNMAALTADTLKTIGNVSNLIPCMEVAEIRFLGVEKIGMGSFGSCSPAV